MSIEMIATEEFNQGTQIKVIGVGGAGGNAVGNMIRSKLEGVDFMVANTDSQAWASRRPWSVRRSSRTERSTRRTPA